MPFWLRMIRGDPRRFVRLVGVAGARSRFQWQEQLGCEMWRARLADASARLAHNSSLTDAIAMPLPMDR
eukprot:2618454-Pyramimonas_sp.AAC.1